MKNMFGITGIRVEKIEIFTGNDPGKKDMLRYPAINDFLKKHDGNIIDIQFVGQLYGIIQVFVTYKED